jgi:hypothetical protein
MRQTVRVLILMLLAATVANAQPNSQTSGMQFYRPNDKAGVGMFETTKSDTIGFNGMTVKIGGAFTQDYQALKSENTATFKAISKTDTLTNANKLVDLTNGFNLAMANLTLDAQLDDGVRANVTMYLSSRHHSEAWVKAGYFQLDKMPFFNSQMLDNLMQNFTIKVGHLEVDFGDQHFRRTDGGNSMYNPFVENYIMDAFATEIGTEIYYHPTDLGFIAMFGITNGMLNPTVVAATGIDAVTNEKNVYGPAVHGKLGYDKQLSEDLRVRLTGSIYNVASTSRNTLYSGDRTGSHYFLVLEPEKVIKDGKTAAVATADNATSGRFNPNLSDELTAIMINPYIKFNGLEVLGSYEIVNGRNMTEVDKRNASQLAVEGIYRFGSTDNFWVGARYNTVTAALPGFTTDVSIDRLTASLGWFITPNVMMKAEYVNQEYKDFPANDIRNGGKFNGIVIEAGLGF